MVRESPGSPSQWKAILSPRPASTCRSRQLYETLRVPPSNQRAKGRSHCRIVLGSSNQVSSSRAWRAQKPSQSASASSYIAWSRTRAVDRNSSGGGNVRSSSRYASIVGSSAIGVLPPSAPGSVAPAARHPIARSDHPLQDTEGAETVGVREGGPFGDAAASLQCREVADVGPFLPLGAGRVDSGDESVGPQEVGLATVVGGRRPELVGGYLA